MIPTLAIGPGSVWYAKNAYYGYTVKIDHHDYAGFPLVSYYTHMSELLVDEKDNGPDGEYVWAGKPIGIVGAGPTHANHCHIELWDFSRDVPSGRKNRAMDPSQFLPHFGQVIVT
jgi:murein DD-endopeptidase MepM/ murein hydrolase activator NlpD